MALVVVLEILDECCCCCCCCLVVKQKEVVMASKNIVNVDSILEVDTILLSSCCFVFDYLRFVVGTMMDDG